MGGGGGKTRFLFSVSPISQPPLPINNHHSLSGGDCMYIYYFCSRFTVSAAYYGLAFNISYLFGNKYLNFGISQLVDLSGVFVLAWAVPRYGILTRLPIVGNVALEI